MTVIGTDLLFRDTDPDNRRKLRRAYDVTSTESGEHLGTIHWHRVKKEYVFYGWEDAPLRVNELYDVAQFIRTEAGYVV